MRKENYIVLALGLLIATVILVAFNLEYDRRNEYGDAQETSEPLFLEEEEESTKANLIAIEDVEEWADESLGKCNFSEGSIKVEAVKNDRKKFITLILKITQNALTHSIKRNLDKNYSATLEESNGISVGFGCGRDYFYLSFKEVVPDKHFYESFHIFRLDKNKKTFFFQDFFTIAEGQEHFYITGDSLKEKMPLIEYPLMEALGYQESDLYLLPDYPSDPDVKIKNYLEWIKASIQGKDSKLLRLSSYPMILEKIFPEKEITSTRYKFIYQTTLSFKENLIYDSALLLLKKLTEAYPNKPSAYLDIGDIHWELKDVNRSLEAYERYVLLMGQSGNKAKIPKRVFKRLSSQ